MDHYSFSIEAPDDFSIGGDLSILNKKTDFFDTLGRYLQYYWYTNKFALTYDLREFPSEISIEIEKIDDSMLLKGDELNSLMILHNQIIAQDKVTSFYRDRHPVAIDKRIKDSEIILKSALSLDYSKTRQEISQQFAVKLNELKSSLGVFEQPSLYESIGSMQLFRTLGSYVSPMVGQSSENVFEVTISRFVKEYQLEGEHRVCLNNLIIPAISGEFTSTPSLSPVDKAGSSRDKDIVKEPSTIELSAVTSESSEQDDSEVETNSNHINDEDFKSTLDSVISSTTSCEKPKGNNSFLGFLTKRPMIIPVLSTVGALGLFSLALVYAKRNNIMSDFGKSFRCTTDAVTPEVTEQATKATKKVLKTGIRKTARHAGRAVVNSAVAKSNSKLTS